MSPTKEQWEKLLGTPLPGLMKTLMGMWLRQCDREPIMGDLRISIPISPDARFDHLPCTYTLKPVSISEAKKPSALRGTRADYVWFDDYYKDPGPWKPKQHSSAVTSSVALMIHEQVFS